MAPPSPRSLSPLPLQEVAGKGSKLAAAVGRDLKGKASALLYGIAVPLAFVNEWIADIIYVLVASMWLIPDRRIEPHVTHGNE